MDAEIAVRVMGLSPEQWDPPCGRYHSTDDAEKDSVIGWMGWCYTCGRPIEDIEGEPPRYSTDIAAAWLVVEKMRADGFATIHVSCGMDLHGNPVPGWYASFFKSPAKDKKGAAARADTLPLAICLAALESSTSPANRGAPRGSGE